MRGGKVSSSNSAVQSSPTHLQMLIELIQDQTHAVHQAVHVRRLAVRVCRAAVTGERGLEGFEVVHPLECEVVRGDIGFIEDEDEGQFGFVENAGEWSDNGKGGKDTTTRINGGMGPRKEGEGVSKGEC